MTAPAAMPTEEEVAAIIDARAFDPLARWRDGEPRDKRRRNAKQSARAILALFAPILAENKRLTTLLSARCIDAESADRERSLAEAALATARADIETLTAKLDEWTEAYRYKGKSYQYRGDERRIVDLDEGAAIRAGE